MIINEYIAMELHKLRTKEDHKVEGNRTLAEIITEFKRTPRRRSGKHTR